MYMWKCVVSCVVCGHTVRGVSISDLLQLSVLVELWKCLSSRLLLIYASSLLLSNNVCVFNYGLSLNSHTVITIYVCVCVCMRLRLISRFVGSSRCC